MNYAYSMPESGDVQLSVYNLQGQLIRTLLKSALTAGMHQIQWNAVNENNKPIASGVYVYRLRVNTENGEKFNFTKMMTLIK